MRQTFQQNDPRLWSHFRDFKPKPPRTPKHDASERKSSQDKYAHIQQKVDSGSTKPRKSFDPAQASAEFIALLKNVKPRQKQEPSNERSYGVNYRDINLNPFTYNCGHRNSVSVSKHCKNLPQAAARIQRRVTINSGSDLQKQNQYLNNHVKERRVSLPVGSTKDDFKAFKMTPKPPKSQTPQN